MLKKCYDLARSFVYRNARPLDLALWKYHFEDGGEDDVLTALAAYQNPDGGFAHAIEPDFWNENSTPIATWAAIGKLEQLGGVDRSHPIVVGILKYLDSGKDLSDGRWHNVVKSNNDYPHAVWWSCDGEGVPSDNPTVSLAGFIIKYADKTGRLYEKACGIARSAVERFVGGGEVEGHVLRCYMELYEFLTAAKVDIVDMSAFKTALYSAVRAAVCADSGKWMTEYVFKPSSFFDMTGLVFDILGKELCAREAALIPGAQQKDGAFVVPWQWFTDYREFPVAENWWKSHIVINNLLFVLACNNDVSLLK